MCIIAIAFVNSCADIAVNRLANMFLQIVLSVCVNMCVKRGVDVV